MCGMIRDRSPEVEDYDWLRPVLDNEVYISNRVAFASYGCGHNVFFKYSQKFVFPRTCPTGDAAYIDDESKNVP